MSKISTLNFLINSYNNGVLNSLNIKSEEVVSNYYLNNDQFGYEPSELSIQSILNFASQYEVVKSSQTGNIELNLN